MNIKEPLQFQEKATNLQVRVTPQSPQKKKNNHQTRDHQITKKNNQQKMAPFLESTASTSILIIIFTDFFYAFCVPSSIPTGIDTKNDSRLTPSRLLPQSPGAAVRHPARPAATFAPRRMGPIKGESVENGKNPLMRVLAAQKKTNSFLWKVFS